MSTFQTLFASSLLVGVPAGLLLWHRNRLQHFRKTSEARCQEALDQLLSERQGVEDILRRTLAMFQLLQDVTAAAGISGRVEDAIQSSLDIICSYTGWPVAHALYPTRDALPGLHPAGIWHLENPHDFEAFLRASEQKPLVMGKGVPGKAWASRRVAWSRFAKDPRSTHFFRLALEAGLVLGFAIPVFKNDELVFVLEFFSPPAPDPDDTMLNALTGVGEQLGRMAERLQAEEEMEKLNQRLVELNEEKNQFLGIASHDLKNPLNTIGLMGELLSMGDLPPEECADLGKRISSEAQRTTKLIQKLLDVTAIESGRFNLRIREVALEEILSTAQFKFQEQATQKGQAIVIEAGQPHCLVLADSDYLLEVVENLLSNALKFMSPGPPLRTVTLGLQQTKAHGLLQIHDEGPGFSEDDRLRAFGRFAKLSARPTGGESSTGLGLSIVKRLVEAMHGTVELESQLGRGSTFRISLPLAP